MSLGFCKNYDDQKTVFFDSNHYKIRYHRIQWYRKINSKSANCDFCKLQKYDFDEALSIND